MGRRSKMAKARGVEMSDHRAQDKVTKSKTSKMTWAKLASDPTISKLELPRIAKAFGLTKPEAKKAPAKKTTAKKTAAQKEPGAVYHRRQKAVAPKAKQAAQKEPAAISATRQRAVAPKKRTPTRMATGTERGFEEGPGGRVTRTSPGGRARGTAAEGKLVRAKDKTKAVDLWTGSAARGKRKFAPKQGPTEYRKYVPRRDR
jgi:hypothetical protein